MANIAKHSTPGGHSAQLRFSETNKKTVFFHLLLLILVAEKRFCCVRVLYSRETTKLKNFSRNFYKNEENSFNYRFYFDISIFILSRLSIGISKVFYGK